MAANRHSLPFLKGRGEYRRKWRGSSPSLPVIARREAPWQSRGRAGLLRYARNDGPYGLGGCTCNGPCQFRHIPLDIRNQLGYTRLKSYGADHVVVTPVRWAAVASAPGSPKGRSACMLVATRATVAGRSPSVRPRRRPPQPQGRAPGFPTQAPRRAQPPCQVRMASAPAVSRLPTAHRCVRKSNSAESLPLAAHPCHVNDRG